MKMPLILVAAALLLAACHKSATLPAAPSFTCYTIRAGQQYCNQSHYQPVSVHEMKFTVRFDSTAIYQTVDPGNQDDINKLYGFADNHTDHHQYSARFGWRWSKGALRLFAYVYNEGSMSAQELGTIAIGAPVACSIKVLQGAYVFSVNGSISTMPRMASTEKGEGYQLYPYFGGDESAPHEIRVYIREEQ